VITKIQGIPRLPLIPRIPSRKKEQQLRNAKEATNESAGPAEIAMQPPRIHTEIAARIWTHRINECEDPVPGQDREEKLPYQKINTTIVVVIWTARIPILDRDDPVVRGSEEKLQHPKIHTTTIAAVIWTTRINKIEHEDPLVRGREEKRAVKAALVI